MGTSNWDKEAEAVYSGRAATRAATGAPVFAVKAAVAPRLDPKGLNVRESRDSAAHPVSNGIIVVLDQTGSMQDVIKSLHEALPKFMTILNAKGAIEGPQILISAIGDARNHETAPLQVGQFEAGIEVEDDITAIFLEGNGGGNSCESYDLMAFVAAYKTSMDCWEKRKEKGFIFFIGDEMVFPSVSKADVKKLLGETIEQDIPIETVFAKLRETYHAFFILPKGASHGGDHATIAQWRKLVGAENVIELADPKAVSETMALQIGLIKGTTDEETAQEDMVAAGSTPGLVRVAADAINPVYRNAGSIARVAPGTLPTDGHDNVSRL